MKGNNTMENYLLLLWGATIMFLVYCFNKLIICFLKKRKSLKGITENGYHVLDGV